MRAPSAPVIEEIDGRDVRIGERWLADFASNDWLGLGLDEEIIDAIPDYLARWGTRAGRISGDGASWLSARLQDELTMLLGADECLVAPSARHIHAAAIPTLAKGGTVFLEDRGSQALRDGCALAQARGATVHTFTRADVDTLATRLSGHWRRPGVICADGVHGESGSAGGLPGLAALARAHELSLYIDDAHGLGLLGRRDPAEICAYGVGGSGIVDHAGLGWDGIVLVASLADALCAPLALLACPARVARTLRKPEQPWQAPGEVSVATLATALEGLRACELRGDRLRALVHLLTERVATFATRLGAGETGDCGFPIVALPLADPAALPALQTLLLERGIYAPTVTAPGPAATARAWLRLQLTAANTDAQIEHLETALDEASARFKLGASAAD